MGIQIELATLFIEPVMRRCWLLNKALENASFDEALKLARAADDFLGMDHANAQALPNEQALKEWLSGKSATGPDQGFQSMATLPIATSPPNRTEQGTAPPSATNHVADIADSFKNAGAAENDLRDDASIKDSIQEIEDEPADSEPPAAITLGLAVLAGMDDVVRYLRQQDDVVVSAGTGTYLVNGRFQLNSEELLARANKIRQRQGKPQFQRIPFGFPAPNGGEALGCSQDPT